MSTYTIDPMHSEILFKVKHLMIANVTGKFNSFNATMEASKEDFSDAKISFDADVASIDTGTAQRDEHLKSDDFFNADLYPKISFSSNLFTKISEEDYKLEGNITIRDITKPIELKVTYGGTMTDFYGQEKSGFEIAGQLSRKSFNLNWSALTEAGGVVVADEIKLHIAVQMTKQP